MSLQRTGPIGRGARLVLAALYAVSLASITGPKLSAQFRNPHILGEPLPWFLHAVMFVTFVLLAGAIGFAFGGAVARRRWQIGAVVVAVVTVLAFEILTRAVYGVGWGFPLADLVWWFDVVMLVEGLVATLLSVAIGLPGCEIGVWPLFISRARGRAALPEEGLACVVGLHYLDAWEASRFSVYGKSDSLRATGPGGSRLAAGRSPRPGAGPACVLPRRLVTVLQRAVGLVRTELGSIRIFGCERGGHIG